MFLLWLALSGCGGAYQELQFTSKQPKLADVAGVYVPDANTLKFMAREGGYSISKHEITLLTNGIILLFNMPDWWTNGFGESNKKLESTNGTWALEKSRNNWQPVLKFGDGVNMGIHLVGQSPPYKLHMYVGDPDSGVYMLFERVRDVLPAGK